MKVLAVTVLVLLCTMALCSEEEEKDHKPCCMSYISRRIPRRLVVNYFPTSRQCPNDIIFVTRRGHQVCANASDAWVQDYISLKMGDLTV